MSKRPYEVPLGDPYYAPISTEYERVGDDEEIEAGAESGENSFGGTIFTIINSIVGGGVVALPFVMNQAGLALGNILIVVMGIVIMFSVKLMISSARNIYGDSKTYAGLAQEALGPRIGKALVDICTGSYILGALIGYVNIVGATLTPLINAINPTSFCINDKFVQLTVAGVLMFPLSSLRSMAMFRFTGLFAFLCIMFVSGAIVYEGIRSIISDGGQIHPNMVYFNFSMDGVFSALPVIGFAYVFHTSFFPIWKSMKDPADKKISVASYVAIALVCLIYVSISTFGYIHFVSKTERNIMKNFPPSNILMIVAKIGYLLVVLCAYPINCFVLRESVDKIFFTGPAPFWRRTLLAFLLTTAALVLAVVIPNLSFVLGLAGALPGAFLSFVFPALFYIILVDNRSSTTYTMLSVNESDMMPLNAPARKKGSAFYLTWQKALTTLILIFGLAVCVISLFTLIQGVISNSGNPSTPSPNPITFWGCPASNDPSNSTAPVTFDAPFMPVDNSTAPGFDSPVTDFPISAPVGDLNPVSAPIGAPSMIPMASPQLAPLEAPVDSAPLSDVPQLAPVEQPLAISPSQ